MPQKIAILGITGAGKSTLSRRIADITGLPLFHMDTLFWRGKWEEVPEAEYIEAHEKILNENNRWIIEGWISTPMFHRLTKADLIIYLDYSGWLAAWHYFERWLKHRKVARPELPAESKDHFKWRRLFLLLFRLERKDIEATLRTVHQPEKVVRFRSPRELEVYLTRRPFGR
jgi:adenylate kinase family enzyme